MSSDSSDSDYEERRSYKSNKDSESDSEHPARRADGGSPRGPQTPKSSPRSQDSLARSHSGFPDDSGELSDSPAVRGRGPRSPPSPPPVDNADDGRSDISSGSSLLSNQDNKDDDVLNLEAGEVDNINDVSSPVVKKKLSPSKNFPVSNADDLSDVSDLDDSDGLEDKEEPEDVGLGRKAGKSDVVRKDVSVEERERCEREKERQERDKKNNLNIDDGEQLDFEADDQPEEKEKEEGELEPDKKEKDKKDDDGDEGEVKEDDAESLEDGEVTDEGDPKPEKPPVCRFFSRGACTWGVNCRFLHPGVTDKGNYTMFDVGRPMVATPNGAVMYPEHRSAYAHPMLPPPARVIPGPYGPVAVRREDPALVESPWERGLRQAKEMMRKSNKRKETDMDFEEKKMNLSIGQDEIDKENDYYTRAASPLDEPEVWARASPKVEGELRRPVRVVDRYEDIVAEPMSPLYEYRRGYERLREPPPEYLRREKKYYEEEEYLPKKVRREKMVREVIVQRVEKPVRERHDPEEVLRRRPDEWSDPWMRSKSPSRKEHRQRKTSYSSGSSSFTSRSGSRSSSNSSYSSYSRSRSRSLSHSHSPLPRSRRPRTPPFPGGKPSRSKRQLSPKDPKFKPLKPGPAMPVERSMLMNPPAPMPKRAKERPLSPSQMRKVGLNPPPPTPKPSSKNPAKHSAVGGKAGKVRTRKSRSSSGSASSGSSSESSRSSYSSSSSTSRGGTPPVRAVKPSKKIEPNERLQAQTLKGKAMDALKISGQKPQIKLTLKPNEAKRDKAALPLVAGKKRPAEEPPAADPKALSSAKPPTAKKTTSRREELLKQLKAVEDAIARKRSKI